MNASVPRNAEETLESIANSPCYTSDEVKEMPCFTEPTSDIDCEIRIILTRKEIIVGWKKNIYKEIT